MTLRQDVRLAFRQMLRRPGTSLAAGLVLAIGIGAFTLLFSLVNCWLLSPLPFEDARRLLLLERINPQTQERTSFWTVEWPSIREAVGSFGSLAAYATLPGHFNLTDAAGTVHRYRSARATANLPDVLRVQPLVGRWFMADEERPGDPPLVVLSYRAWKRDFLADREILGRDVRLDGEPATVIGVMPEGFHFPDNQDIWSNLRWDRPLATPLVPIGRLKPGISRTAASAELQVLGRRWARDLVPRFSNWLAATPEMRSETEYFLGKVRDYEGYTLVRPLGFKEKFRQDEGSTWAWWAMLGLGFCIVLIACGNVATLLCARASTRTRETAVRAALGASRGRLITQMLLESMLIAALGAFGGLILSSWGGRFLSSYLAQQAHVPFWLRLVHDGRVFLASLLAMGVAGLASGLVPALRSSRLDVGRVLQHSGSSRSGLRIGRFNRRLVVAEIALSIPLLLLAGAMAKTVFLAATSLPAGDPDRVLVARLDLTSSTEPCDEWLRRLTAIPGVLSASLSDSLCGAVGPRVQMEFEGDPPTSPQERSSAFLEVVSPRHFRTLERNLLQGRDFDGTDTLESMPVAIVNESFARKHWPAENPLGKRFRCFLGPGPQWLTVIGVAPDLHMQGIQANRFDGAGFYLAYAQRLNSEMTVFVRVQGDPLALAPALQRAIHALTPDRLVPSIVTLPSAAAQATSVLRIVAVLFVAFGLAALSLAGVGVAGIMSFTVTQRRQEFGVRMAMGATPGSILRRVLLEAAGQLALGLLFGLILAGCLGTTHITQAVVSPYDPTVGLSVTAAVMFVALLAVWLPARRAARVDPMVALRDE